jgi:AcrR family transcriptional regulator
MEPDGQVGGPAFEDLTARARIRDAALRHFAEHGFARATIRGIAKAAGVSPGLVRHHFGSKDELRRACDEYVLDALRKVNEQVRDDSALANPVLVSSARRAVNPFQSYVARALVDGSETAATLFDQLVTMTEQWLVRHDAERESPPLADSRTRAALIIAMKMAVPVMHRHVSRAIGADIFSDEGDRRVVLGLLDIHSHPLISAELAEKAKAGFDGPRHESSP